MHSLHNLTIFLLCMSIIVHNHTEHVDKKRRLLHGNIMSCRHRSTVGEVAPPPAILDCILEEDNCLDGDSEGADHSCLPHEVFALTWHVDVGHIMHMVPCIAYIIHLICHQLSLDLLCVNATCLVSISYSHRF